MNESTIKIYCAKEYHKFKPHPLQRPVNDKHVTKLVKAIRANNRLYQNPGRVDSDGYVVDGYHRLKAAEALDVPWCYTVEKTASPESLWGENDVTRRWGLVDFAISRANSGNPSYQKVVEWIDNYPWLGPSPIVFSVLRVSTAKFKGGKLMLSHDDISECEAVIAKMDELRQLEPLKKVWTARVFGRALPFVIRHPQYNHKTMVRRILAQPRNITICNTTTHVYEMLTEVYNYHVMKKNHVDFTQ